MTPIVGDWDGNGTDTVGLYDPTDSIFYLRNSNTTGIAERGLLRPSPRRGITPVVGDWTGGGRTRSVCTTPPHRFSICGTAIPADLPMPSSLMARPAAVRSPSCPRRLEWRRQRHGRVVQFDHVAVLPAEQQYHWICRHGLRLRSGQRRLWFRWLEVGQYRAAGNSGRPGGRSPKRADVDPKDLQPIVNEAITLWSQAGLDAARVQKLRQAQFVITNLPDAYLGETEGNVVYLDANAAGNGWFVDPTPATNEEFSASAGSQQLQAVNARALDRIDLLTVVEHELGHVAGLGDLDSSLSDLMSSTLDKGIRRQVAQATLMRCWRATMA